MSYNHNRSPRSTPRDPSTKKHVNQRLFLLAFVLPSTSPLIFLIISKIESILRPASTQIYNWNAFFTTAQWVVFFLVAYAIGIIAGIAGLIYLIGREKRDGMSYRYLPSLSQSFFTSLLRMSGVNSLEAQSSLSIKKM